MIISASRRTDIPAFYSEWFFNRIREGYVLVRNPLNYHQISKISLKKDVVDCIVFWTKNPERMMDSLDILKDYSFYFQFTLNPYGATIERNVPENARVIKCFLNLSEKIGKNRVIWRYDPILLSEDIDEEYHYHNFDLLSYQLKDHTEKCIISFLDFYKKIKGSLKALQIHVLSDERMRRLVQNFKIIAEKHGLQLEICGEELDFQDIGIKSSKCIDDRLISELIGRQIIVKKDKGQRKACNCAASIDIGCYNTCRHGCRYCYANYHDQQVYERTQQYDKTYPLLCSTLSVGDRVYERKVKSNVSKQELLFHL